MFLIHFGNVLEMRDQKDVWRRTFMNKAIKKIFTFLIALMLLITGIESPCFMHESYASDDTSFKAFLVVEAGDNLEYLNFDDQSTPSKMTVKNAEFAAGDTFTIGVTFDNVARKVNRITPFIVAKNVKSLDYTIESLKINGVEMSDQINYSAGNAWNYEGTGNYSNKEAISLAGGYYKYGDQFISEPTNVKSITFTITVSKIVLNDGTTYAPGLAEYPIYIAAAAGKDWDRYYYDEVSNTARSQKGIKKAVTGKIKQGQTVTVSITFDSKVNDLWYFAPVIVTGNGVSKLEYRVDSFKVDNVEKKSTIDFDAGDSWWYEATGSHTAKESIRLGCGYSSFGTKYVSEPKNFTTISYTITLVAIAQNGKTYGIFSREESPEFKAFIAYGGESAPGAWDYFWAVEDTKKAGITGDVVAFKQGQTVNISVQLPKAAQNTYYFAPAVLASGIKTLEYTIDSFKVDGVEMKDKIDFTAGGSKNAKAWWYEDTGSYSNKEAIRLAGGYNYTGEKYVDGVTKGYTTLSYTITFNTITTKERTSYTGTFHSYLALTAGTADGTKDLCYYESKNDNAKIVSRAVDAKVGEKFTISLMLPEAAVHTYDIAPVIALADIADIDYTISAIKFDGTSALNKLNMKADDKQWWHEAVGKYPEKLAVKLAGGYDEHATKYLSAVPTGYKKVEYTITVNSIVVGKPYETPAVTNTPATTEAKYHAYLGFQTDTSRNIFRTAWDDATYGRSTEMFAGMHAIDDQGRIRSYAGTFVDADITGDGTYTVVLDSPDFSKETHFGKLFISTDIPMSKGLEFTKVTIKSNGKEIGKFDKGILDQNARYATCILQDTSNSKVNDLFKIDLAHATKIEVTFVVSGIGRDKQDEPNTTPGVNPTITPAKPTSTPGDGPKMPSPTILIVAGVSLAVIVIALLVYFLGIRRKRNDDFEE